MKKLFITTMLLVGFSITSCRAQTIGIVTKDNNFQITTDLAKIKSEWETVLKNQKTPATIVDFKITESIDEKLGDKVYFLVGYNAKKDVKIGRYLVLSNGTFSFSNAKINLSGTVTCSGCSAGCNPKMFNGEPYCSSGCGLDPCTKTVTTTF